MTLLSIIFPTMERWFSCITMAAFRSKEAAICCLRNGFFTTVIKRVALAAFTCFLALGTFSLATLFYWIAITSKIHGGMVILQLMKRHSKNYLLAVKWSIYYISMLSLNNYFLENNLHVNFSLHCMSL
jgi:hypothetical protein